MRILLIADIHGNSTDHTLYGTTEYGGETGYCTTGGCGTAFNLKPSPTACKTALCPWIEAIVHRFTSGGVFPESEVIFDSRRQYLRHCRMRRLSLIAGGGKGCYPCGAVYKLTPSSGGWTETVLYTFTGYEFGADGAGPIGGADFRQRWVIFTVRPRMAATAPTAHVPTDGIRFRLG